MAKNRLKKSLFELTQSNYNTTRFKKMDDCKTPEELAENIWRAEATDSNPHKQKLFLEWLDCYKNKKPFINFNHQSPKQLAEDIYKPDWDESDGLFQGLREHLIKWIDNYCKA